MKYRVYFNRAEDFPQVWSVDEGSHASEINVQRVVIEVPIEARYTPEPDNVWEPRGWFEAEGQLVIDGGTAFIKKF